MSALTQTHTILGSYAEQNALLQVENARLHEEVEKLRAEVKRLSPDEATPARAEVDTSPGGAT